MINVDKMSLEELYSLSNAIVAEAEKRARLALDIAGKSSRRYEKKLPSGRKGIYSPDLFKMCADKGMTARQAAEKIGCHVTYVYAAQKRFGIKFAKAKTGRSKS
jgi:hypothetical protein